MNLKNFSNTDYTKLEKLRVRTTKEKQKGRARSFGTL